GPPRSPLVPYTTLFRSDRALAFLLQAVGERRGRRLVDDAQHLQAGDRPGVLGRLALRIVEIGGHGDDRLAHLLAEIALGGLLHLDRKSTRLNSSHVKIS